LFESELIQVGAEAIFSESELNWLGFDLIWLEFERFPRGVNVATICSTDSCAKSADNNPEPFIGVREHVLCQSAAAGKLMIRR
jgi:hypothetical protein